MLELAVAACLIVLNGLFALSELSVVSARKGRLKAMAERGKRGAATALELAEEPGRFLSTVQIGITLIGILAGAFSGAALGDRLRVILIDRGMPDWLAEPAGYGIVISIITYLSVVIGELVPKHFALRNPETIACFVAPPMKLLSRVGAPAVWLLDASTRMFFRLIGQNKESENPVTEDELKSLIADAEVAGIIDDDEKRMMAGVLRLGDRKVSALMTPRRDVEWLDVTVSIEAIRLKLLNSSHSRLPAAEGNIDNMIGVIQSREVLGAMLVGVPFDLRDFVHAAPVIPDAIDALQVLDMLRKAELPMALVHDEYGSFEGLVTPADLLTSITGVFQSDGDDDDAAVIVREDGSYLISGAMPADEMAERIGLHLPADRDYHTVAGMLIAELRHLPKTGDYVDTLGWRFEIVDMDGRRIDKILACRRK